jgi:hypothetical protein
MTAQTARMGAPRKHTGPKQNTRKKRALSRHNGKDAELTRQPRTLRQAKKQKQNKREYSAFGEPANDKGRNRHDEQAANQQVNPNDAPGLVNGRASATQGPIDQQHGRPASSHDPQQGMQLKERLDDPIQANGAGPRLTHTSMLPMQAIALAHWQFWATAMAAYPRAWISASSPWLGRRLTQ